MTTRECAIEIEPDATPTRLHEIEQSLHKLASSLFFEAATAIDDDALNYRMNYAHEAARLCRDKAYEHLNQT